MRSELHPFYTTKSHCVSVDSVTCTQGLAHTALTKRLPKMLLQWSGWVSLAPVHPGLLCTGASCPLQQRPIVWWLHEVWTHHPFSWLYNKSSTTVVTNALRVGVLSLAVLLETAGDSDGESKGLTETTAQQWGWTDEKLPRATFWISSGWLKEWLPLSPLFKASKSIVYHYAEILLCTIKMQPALHKAELSFNGIRQYYKRQQLKWYHF